VAGQQRVEDARERAFVPATPIILALCLNVRGRRDKPGDDAGMRFKAMEIPSDVHARDYPLIKSEDGHDGRPTI